MADIDVTAYRFVGVNRQTARRLRRTLLASTTGVDDHGKSLGVPSRTAQVELLAYFRWREHEDSVDSARVAGIFAVIGGVLLLVGSFLPWVTATTIVGQLSINGVAGGDGKITAAAGAAATGFLLHGLLGRNWSSYLIGALAAVAGVLVAGYDYTNLSDLLVSDDGFSAQRGVGIYACCGGGLLAAVAGFVAMVRAKLSTPSPTYAPTR